MLLKKEVSYVHLGPLIEDPWPSQSFIQFRKQEITCKVQCTVTWIRLVNQEGLG